MIPDFKFFVMILKLKLLTASGCNILKKYFAILVYVYLFSYSDLYEKIDTTLLALMHPGDGHLSSSHIKLSLFSKSSKLFFSTSKACSCSLTEAEYIRQECNVNLPVQDIISTVSVVLGVL